MTIRSSTPNLGGFVPFAPTGFAQRYRGPVFDAEGGAAGGDGGAAAAAAAKAAADKTAADKAAADAAAAAAANKPSDNEAALLREVMAQKAALKAAKDEAAALKAQFDGIDPVKVKELLAAQAKAEEDALKKAGDFEALKQRMAAEHQRELEAERAKVTAEAEKVTKAQKTIRELTVGSAFLGSKFLAEDTVLPADIARVAYDDHFEVEDGKVVAYTARRGDATRAPVVNGSGQPLSFDEALKRIVEAQPNKDKILRSKQVTGAGTDNRNHGGGNNNNGGTNNAPKLGEYGHDPISTIAAALAAQRKK